MRARVLRSPRLSLVLSVLLAASLLGTVGVALAQGPDDPVANAGAGDFYSVRRNFDCPEGGGSCQTPPQKARILCDPGDIAVGGLAWTLRVSDARISSHPARFTGGVPAIGLAARESSLPAGERLSVQITCADLTP